MKHPLDYLREMRATRTLDREIEELLTGAGHNPPELEQVASFLGAWRDHQSLAPKSREPARDAARLARVNHVVSAAPTRTRRRLTFVLAGGAMVVGLAGTAMAANGASPGDGLYQLDRALEVIGIGSGGAFERIEEADALIARGEEDAGITHLATTIDEAVNSGDFETAGRVQRHLDLALAETSAQAGETQKRVAEIQAFIDENKGRGTGVDGKEFGQGISQIARGLDSQQETSPAVENDVTSVTQTPTTAAEASSNGPPANAGPKDGHGHAPDHAGPKDEPKDNGNPNKGQGNQGHPTDD